MRFDPTPDAVKLYRVNAIGFGVSLLAIFAAMTWWMAPALAVNAQVSVFIVGFMVAIGLFTAGFYVLPAFVPRKPWGFVVALVQIFFSLTSGTATLPTIPVLIGFLKGETRDWFDRKPIDPRSQDPAGARSKVWLIAVYYAVMSALPFGVVGLVGPMEIDGGGGKVAEAVQTGGVHVTKHKGHVHTERLSGAEALTGQRVTSGAAWSLADEPGPVAVTVWASWCGACGSQLSTSGPELGGVKHISMAVDCDKNLSKVRQKLSKSGARADAYCTSEDLKVDRFPTTLFFDSHGRKRVTLSGYQSVDTLDTVGKALAGR